ncbi:hypothetical protein GOHSU_31_00250 [Gordonia hirsuta DSM 44140 = NBRC 16056]|uniref:DUF2721 domain-containing protein n=1 Tax=Gordonia hirsuta DSM 44140 = NBRC 16056 TaxID=1121927 RepID=L7LB70_9ACTN|nr:hypothetical protein [Gordonia hirsuta]GAC58164.1 hypothetical protein GOHSU_31_00250 [Gordonia hirsuta DSM 44140 = NBRC 16056]
MDNWGILAGLGLLAAAVATIAYVRYRQRESAAMMRQVDLARGLRDLAGADPVRLACVDEFETGLYQRLFYVSAVGPRMRSAAWALLVTLLAAAAALIFDAADGVAADVFWGVSLLVAALFGIATIVYLALAGFAAATTPRVSFTDSYQATSDDAED